MWISPLYNSVEHFFFIIIIGTHLLNWFSMRCEVNHRRHLAKLLDCFAFNAAEAWNTSHIVQTGSRPQLITFITFVY